MSNNPIDLDTLRHSTAHVMAAAVCRLFDHVQLDIGPSTDDGTTTSTSKPASRRKISSASKRR